MRHGVDGELHVRTRQLRLRLDAGHDPGIRGSRPGPLRQRVRAHAQASRWAWPLADPIVVTPPVDDLEVQPTRDGSGSLSGRVTLAGSFRPNTRYRVRVPASLATPDGRTIGRAVERTAVFGGRWFDEEPGDHLSLPPGRLLTLASSVPAAISAARSGMAHLRMQVVRVPTDRIASAAASLVTDGDADHFAAVGVPTPRPRPLRIRRGLLALPELSRSGAVLLRVFAPGDGFERWMLVQRSHAVALVHTDHLGAAVRVFASQTGRPIAGAEVELRGADATTVLGAGTTGATGLAEITGRRPTFAIVRHAGAESWLDMAPRPGGRALTGMLWASPRQYLPGERVDVHVAARVLEDDALGTSAPSSATRLDCQLGLGEREMPFEVSLDEHGVGHGAVTLPGDTRSPRATLSCRHETLGGRLRTRIHVGIGSPMPAPRWWAPPAFELLDPRAHWIAGDRLAVRVTAPNWRAPTISLSTSYRTPAAYAPPGHPGVLFGTHTSRDPYGSSSGSGGRAEHTLSSAGVAEATMTLRPRSRETSSLRVDSLRAGDPGVEVIVHPASVLVGLHDPGPWVLARSPTALRWVVTRPDGTPVAGQRIEVVLRDGRVGRRRVVSRCELTTDAEGLGVCALTAPRSGPFLVEAVALDSDGRQTTTTARFTALGADPLPDIRVFTETAYAEAGQPLRIAVAAPFDRGMGMLTLERHGVVSAHPLEIRDGWSGPLDIPVPSGAEGDIYLRVTLSSPDGGESASEGRRVPVRGHSRRLDVTAQVPERALPGAPLSVDVRVMDRAGPVEASVAVALVRASAEVLPQHHGCTATSARTALFPSRTSTAVAAGPASARATQVLGAEVIERRVYGCGGVVTGIEPGARGATLFFRAGLRVAADGRLQLRVPMPVEPGRYVLHVLGVGAEAAGAARHVVTVRPAIGTVVSVAASARRGDRIDATLTLHNDASRSANVRWQARASGLSVNSAGPQQLRLAPGQTRRVPIALLAQTSDVQGTLQIAIDDGAQVRLLERPVALSARALTTEGRSTAAVSITRHFEFRGDDPDLDAGIGVVRIPRDTPVRVVLRVHVRRALASASIRAPMAPGFSSPDGELWLGPRPCRGCDPAPSPTTDLEVSRDQGHLGDFGLRYTADLAPGLYELSYRMVARHLSLFTVPPAHVTADGDIAETPAQCIEVYDPSGSE